MKPAKASETPTGRLNSSRRRTKKMTAAKRPRVTELRQVGGASPLVGTVRFDRARLFASSRLRGRPLRGLVSTRPPWVPRFLPLRRFFVSAMSELNLIGRVREPPLDHAAGRVEAANRHVLGIAGERRLRDQAD